MDSCPFPYVPRYIKGELLFSWVSRLHFLNAKGNPRQTLNELFGSSTGIPSADLPCRLDTFVKRTAGWGPFTSSDDVALSSTLFSYYGAFFTPERFVATLGRLKEDRADGLKVAMGIVANGFGASTVFRSCRQCDNESLSQNGYVVLSRVHQLPGVLLCPYHVEPLCQHFMQSLQPHRQTLIVPATKIIDTYIPTRNLHLQKIASLSAEALESPPTGLTAANRSRTYMQGLEMHGFLLNGRVDWEVLAKSLRYEYSDFVGLSFRNRLLSSERFPLRWLRDLCERPDRSLHPLCHLLLIGMIFGTVRNFVLAANTPTVRNPSSAAPCQQGKTQTEAQIKTDYILLNNKELSCRQVAQKVGVSVTTVVIWRKTLDLPVNDRRKSITSTQLDEIERLLKAKKAVAEIAVLTRVSVSTVNRVLGTLPNVAEIRKVHKNVANLANYRAKWLDAIAENPTLGIQMVRAVAGAAYAWLYRHDRSWLIDSISARPNISRRPRNSRVDWPKRDLVLCDVINTEAQRLRFSSSRDRVSAASLLRAATSESNWRRNIEKLPLVTQAIIENTEDDEMFRKRRRGLAKADLAKKGHLEPAEWRIQQASGIRKK
ncbi:TnsD family Tn7-like transposition protein [Massilia sp. CMS3.1]|uniref:TnsD family Tn7-like transposition protein n=1 Tax=Massilia sp. CMS3.1 TaxID=3373083 RepID=UPI003EE7650F